MAADAMAATASSSVVPNACFEGSTRVSTTKLPERVLTPRLVITAR